MVSLWGGGGLFFYGMLYKIFIVCKNNMKWVRRYVVDYKISEG